MSCWNGAILQTYFCIYILNMKYIYFKYTFGDILFPKFVTLKKIRFVGFKYYFESIKNLVMKYIQVYLKHTSNMLQATWSIPQVHFKYIKYTSSILQPFENFNLPYKSTFLRSIATWSILFELMHFFKLRSILKMNLNLCIYIQTQKYTFLVDFLNRCIHFKYTGSRFFKLMYLSSNFEVYLKLTFNIDVFILKLWSILEVDFLN